MRIHPRSLALAVTGVLVLGLSACGATESSIDNEADTFELSDIDMIESGREIVEAQCISCHAVGLNDRSPRSDAPPLRTVLAGYPPEILAEDFRERVHVGHPDMPDFEFGPIGTDHVIAYLISIQDAETSIE
ncbi:MAG: c-type cytochrome [Henriciella sp.]